MSGIVPLVTTDPTPGVPLLTHEDRDLLHEVAEIFYNRLTTLDKERGDKVWDLAERLQQWIDEERQTTLQAQLYYHATQFARYLHIPVIDETELGEG